MTNEELEDCKKQLAELENSLTEENLAELTKEQVDGLVENVAKLKVELEIAEALGTNE